MQKRARDLHRDALWPGPALKAQHEIEVLDQNRRFFTLSAGF